MSMSTSSASGSTATVAAEVWMRPCALGLRHALDAVDAALELERARRRRCPVISATISLIAADARSASASIISTRQPLGLGVALVHAEQVGGEQRRLFAAGAGADLEDRRAVVGLVLRQQRELRAPARPRAVAARCGRAPRRRGRASRGRRASARPRRGRRGARDSGRSPRPRA